MVGALLVSTTASAAQAAELPPINANGNAVTGGLSFTPPFIQAQVGDAVSWSNTDPVAPHTVTERHNLWNLAGSYGPPLSPGGFPPGAKVARRFEAGTHDYLCLVHGPIMSGRVAVPVALDRAGRKVRGTWASVAEPNGLGFDVQRRTAGSSKWQTVMEDTTRTSAIVGKLRKGGAIEVRARLEAIQPRAGAPAAATGWSPTARIKG